MEKTWIFWLSKLHWKKYVETTCIFWQRQLHQRKYVEITWIFQPLKYIENSMWKQHEFFEQQNHVDKNTLKRRGFFNRQNYIEKVYGNDVESTQWTQHDSPSIWCQNSTWKFCLNYIDLERWIHVEITSTWVLLSKSTKYWWVLHVDFSISFRRWIDVISVLAFSIVWFPNISAVETYSKLFWYSAEPM